MTSGLLKTAAVCCAITTFVPCPASGGGGDPFLQRAVREMEQQDATPPPAAEDGKAEDVDSHTPRSAREQRDKDRRAAARAKLQAQRDARAVAKAERKMESLGPTLAQADRLLDAGRYMEAAAVLQKAAKDIAPLHHPRVQAMLGQLALLDGKPAKALEFVGPVLKAHPFGIEYDPEVYEPRMIFGRAHLALANDPARSPLAVQQEDDRPTRSTAARTAGGGNSFFGIPIDEAGATPEAPAADPVKADTTPAAPDHEAIKRQHAEAALRVFDQIVSDSFLEARHTWYALHPIEAAEGCGQALILLGRAGQAVKSYEFAIAYAQNTEALFDNTDDLAPFMSRLRKGLDEARYAWDIERYGKAFVRYRDAERHRRQTKRYERAIEVYEELAREYPDTIWAEAAGFYTGWCLREQSKLREAAGWWRKFIADDPHGLYRGEAMIALGDLTLEHDLNAPRAIERYEQAIGWLAEIEQYDEKNEPEKVEDRARQVAAAAASRVARDGWGNVVVADNRIGAVVNRSNTPWYLDKLRYDAHLKLGFAHAAAGNNEQATEAFATLQTYDARAEEDEKRIWDTTSQRLAKALDPQRNGPRNENDHLRVFQGKRRVAAYLGNLNYDALEWDKARALYTRLLDGEMGALTPAEEAYTVYLLGNIEHMAGNEKQAFNHLKAFETEERYAKTPIAAKALYTYGAIACQYRMRGDTYEETWQRILPLVVKRYPQNPQAERALFHFGFASFHTGNKETAADAYRAYLERYPEGRFRDISTRHLQEMR
jgi:tetratricopeptide (TPR) repeat protein